MFKRIRILWIEEETQSVLAEIRSRLDNSRGFIVEIVETLVSAHDVIDRANIYDIIIVDIRIPKELGASHVMESIYVRNQYEKHGIDLVKILLNKGLQKKMLIFTNESKMAIDQELGMDKLSNGNFLQKTANITPEEFVMYLKNIYQSNSAT
jgi:CheY-like chemotaxis protein